jgi:hypothetical protein
MQRIASSLQRIACRLGGIRSGRHAGASCTAVHRAARGVAAGSPWAAAPRWPARRALSCSTVDRARAGSGSGGLSEVEADLQLPTHCSGCGVDLQQEDPESPGCAWPAARRPVLPELGLHRGGLQLPAKTFLSRSCAKSPFCFCHRVHAPPPPSP